MGSLKEQHLLEMENFSNIIHVCTVTFDQLNASLPIKDIYFLKNKSVRP